MLWLRWCGILVLAVCLAGCEPPPATPPAAPTSAATWVPTRANPRLPTVRLWLGTRELDAELCVTPEQIGTGLMFRPGIKDDELMLFIFQNPGRARFYMKNVDFDIDVAYIASDGRISEVVRLKTRDATPVPSKADDIQFVLEAAPGWFEKNQLRAGSLVRLPQGSLRTVLGPRAQSWLEK